jgi:hypothetical protein
VFAPAGVATRVDVSGIDVGGTFKLDVISGGPVFLWFGREDTANAQRMVTPASNGNSVQFDMACSANSDAEREIDGGFSTVTIFAVADTIAYIQFTPDSEKKRIRSGR